MGFLLGAFGKLAAGRRVRDLQARMMRVQSKLRRTSRQVEYMTKQLERSKKAELNAVKMQANGYQNMSMMAAIQQIAGIAGAAKGGDANGADPKQTGGSNVFEMSNIVSQFIQGALPVADYMGLTDDKKSMLSTMANQLSTSQAQTGSQVQAYQAAQQQQIEEKYEQLNEMMLEPLKDEEDELQTEKDSLESQLQVAQADYEACKKMEQADAKALAPNYTAG